jgi:hypothetical protein
MQVETLPKVEETLMSRQPHVQSCSCRAGRMEPCFLEEERRRVIQLRLVVLPLLTVVILCRKGGEYVSHHPSKQPHPWRVQEPPSLCEPRFLEEERRQVIQLRLVVLPSSKVVLLCRKGGE